ncbi:recombinase family protein [Streptomyces sp. NBC_00433]
MEGMYTTADGDDGMGRVGVRRGGRGKRSSEIPAGPVSPYDGCGKCLVAVRRLSRKKDATSSPEKQAAHDLAAAAAVGGHVIAWADDWEVSGATDPMTRPGLGPWLRGEMGPYSGIVGPSVDRIGRNQRDVLNTAYAVNQQDRLLVTYGHQGPWDLGDQADEMRLSMESFGAQMELRAIEKRNRDAAVTARKLGKPNNAPRYGYRFVRKSPMGRIDHVEIDPEAAAVIREVARRILADSTGTITPHSEAARLNRAGVLSPSDYKAVRNGREPEGSLWSARALIHILTSEGSLGFLMHKERPVLNEETGQPIRLCEGLWDRPMHDALMAKCQPKARRSPGAPRAPKGVRLASGRGTCGVCGYQITVATRPDGLGYRCNGKRKGARDSQECRPAPSIKLSILDAELTTWFLARYGSGQIMRKEYDPGTGYGVRIAELKADRARLRADRLAGLYTDDDDADWYREQYARIGREIKELQALPERPAGMRMMPTGKTVAEAWAEAPDDAARREMLASYGVEFKLYPAGGKRLEITGMDLHTLAAAA